MRGAGSGLDTATNPLLLTEDVVAEAREGEGEHAGAQLLDHASIEQAALVGGNVVRKARHEQRDLAVFPDEDSALLAPFGGFSGVWRV